MSSDRLCPNIHLDANGKPQEAPTLREIVVPSGAIIALQCPVCLKTYCPSPGFHEFLEVCEKGVTREQVERYLNCGRGAALGMLRQMERGRYLSCRTIKPKEKGKGKRTNGIKIWTTRNETTSTGEQPAEARKRP